MLELGRKTVQCAFAPALNSGGGDGVRMRDRLDAPDWGQDLWWGRTVIVMGGDGKSSKSIVESLTAHPVTQVVSPEHWRAPISQNKQMP